MSLKEKPSFDPTERIGINAVEGIFLKDFKWIFREQPISDMGIDAHVEIVTNEQPTGQLIAMQIKTGPSHFYIKDDSLTYYGNLRHLDYWLNHSLVVLIIAHLPDEGKTYWQLVNTVNFEYTDKAWKIEIPLNQELSSTYKNIISKFSNGTQERERRLKLLMDKPLMQVLEKGGKISIDFTEWLHKSFGRTVISLHVKPFDEEEYIDSTATIFFGKGEPYDVIKELFPWASIKNDSEFYETNLDEDSLSGMYNLEWLYTQAIYPYRVRLNEVADFRVELKLNELGKGYLMYINFIEVPDEIDWVDMLPDV